MKISTFFTYLEQIVCFLLIEDSSRAHGCTVLRQYITFYEGKLQLKNLYTVSWDTVVGWGIMFVKTNNSMFTLLVRPHCFQLDIVFLGYNMSYTFF